MTKIEKLIEVVKQEGINSVDLSNKEVFDIFELLSDVVHQYEKVVWEMKGENV